MNTATATTPTTTPLETFSPAMDLYETADAVTVLVDLPGVTSEQLTVEFEGGILTLNTAGVADDRHYLHQEFHPGHFQRSLRLSDNLDASAISANLEDGLLTLTIPRSAASLPRKIEIQSS
ncbi:MAG: Hsp20/alpha crystallin family protein [Planctomycetota bacterium]